MRLLRLQLLCDKLDLNGFFFLLAIAHLAELSPLPKFISEHAHAHQHHDRIVRRFLDKDETGEEEAAKPGRPAAPELIKEEGDDALLQQDGVQVGHPDERGHLEEDEYLANSREVRRLPEQDEVDNEHAFEVDTMATGPESIRSTLRSSG